MILLLNLLSLLTINIFAQDRIQNTFLFKAYQKNTPNKVVWILGSLPQDFKMEDFNPHIWEIFKKSNQFLVEITLADQINFAKELLSQRFGTNLSDPQLTRIIQSIQESLPKTLDGQLIQLAESLDLSSVSFEELIDVLNWNQKITKYRLEELEEVQIQQIKLSNLYRTCGFAEHQKELIKNADKMEEFQEMQQRVLGLYRNFDGFRLSQEPFHQKHQHRFLRDQGISQIDINGMSIPEQNNRLIFEKCREWTNKIINIMSSQDCTDYQLFASVYAYYALLELNHGILGQLQDAGYTIEHIKHENLSSILNEEALVLR